MRRFSSSWHTLRTKLGISSRRRRSHRRKAERRHRTSRIETLEVRSMLTADLYTVTTLDDVVDANDGLVSLREALDLAATDGSTTDNDSIVFDRALWDSGSGTIQLADQSGDGVADQLNIDSDVTVSAPTHAITVSGGDVTRVFSIGAGSTVTIVGLVIADGYTTTDGGGVKNAGSLTLRDARVMNNDAEQDGGGVYTPYGTSLEVVGTTFSGNTADRGAGLYVAATGSDKVSIESSTFTDNTAIAIQSVHNGRGGGVYIYGAPSEPIEILNTTFSGNFGVKGGGLFAEGSPPIVMVNSTITQNDTSPLGLASSNKVSGGGTHIQGNTALTLHNTIVAENTSTAGYRTNRYGTFDNTSSHNVVQKNEGGTSTGGLVDGVLGNQILEWSDEVGLAPLADNGGLTQTHEVLPSSEALVGKGSAAEAEAYGLAGDQRHGTAAMTDRAIAANEDPANLSVDVGAYQSATQMIEIAPHTTKINSDNTDGSQTTPWIATNEAGATVVAWQGDGPEGIGIYVQLLNPGTLDTSVSRRVNLSGSTIGGEISEVQVAVDEAGRHAVMWVERTETEDVLYLRRYAANGTVVDDLPVLVGEGVLDASVVTNNAGRVVVHLAGQRRRPVLPSLFERWRRLRCGSTTRGDWSGRRAKGTFHGGRPPVATSTCNIESATSCTSSTSPPLDRWTGRLRYLLRPPTPKSYNQISIPNHRR